MRGSARPILLMVIGTIVFVSFLPNLKLMFGGDEITKIGYFRVH